MDTADWYRAFAELEAAGSSPVYERLCHAIADSSDVVELIDSLPPAKRQPNLVLACCRFLDAPFDAPDETLAFMRDRWDEVDELARDRSTQTNEPARTGTFLPLLAQLEHPIALIEVGAAAGLCLYPDRYRFCYDQLRPIGPSDSPVRIDVATTGPVPFPTDVPEVVWRAGIDLHPLDVRDAHDLEWLSACVWPEHTERRERLLGAAEVVATDPPELVRGDLVEGIDELIDAVPAGVTPVVFHSAVLAYLETAARTAFAERIRARPDVVWISNEGPGVVESLVTGLAPPTDVDMKAFFVVGLNGERVVALSHPHGRWLRWDSPGG